MKSKSPRVSLSPEAALKRFEPAAGREEWPAWISVQWEEPYLFKRWLGRLWDVIRASDPESAERVVLYPADSATSAGLLEEIGGASLFSSTRLVIAHLQRNTRRCLQIPLLAERLAGIPGRTVVVLAAEGVGWFREDTEKLMAPSPGGRRAPLELVFWKPFPDRIDALAREILSVTGLNADAETLSFWLDRLGSNLERLHMESKSVKALIRGSEVTREILEDLFESPHVHDRTLWDALKLLFQQDSRAQAEVERLLRSSDAQAVVVRLSQALLCVQALVQVRLGIDSRGPDDVFKAFDVKWKRRKDLLLEAASQLSRPIPHLASRLLDLDVSVKQAKTPAARQETVLRCMTALCGEPEPAA
ncbi:hypothetical protein HY522_00675 [bacterium]|nr:hypothetical protein [bacterium]